MLKFLLEKNAFYENRQAGSEGLQKSTPLLYLSFSIPIPLTQLTKPAFCFFRVLLNNWNACRAKLPVLPGTKLKLGFWSSALLAYQLPTGVWSLWKFHGLHAQWLKYKAAEQIRTNDRWVKAIPRTEMVRVVEGKIEQQFEGIYTGRHTEICCKQERLSWV